MASRLFGTRLPSKEDILESISLAEMRMTSMKASRKQIDVERKLRMAMCRLEHDDTPEGRAAALDKIETLTKAALKLHGSADQGGFDGFENLQECPGCEYCGASRDETPTLSDLSSLQVLKSKMTTKQYIDTLAARIKSMIECPERDECISAYIEQLGKLLRIGKIAQEKYVDGVTRCYRGVSKEAREKFIDTVQSYGLIDQKILHELQHVAAPNA